MKILTLLLATRQSGVATLLVLLLAASPPAPAGPGANGPNGEHLDGASTLPAGATLPRAEAKSDAFELVATLSGGELSVLIDRHDSNEPVLGATLEVESGGVKARATFHADHGDYAFDDKRLLALLSSPGEHALVFTLVAGKESDLLDAILVNAKGRTGAKAAGDDHGLAHGAEGHGHDHALERAAWTGAVVAALGLFGGVAWWQRRRRDASRPQGGL